MNFFGGVILKKIFCFFIILILGFSSVLGVSAMNGQVSFYNGSDYVSSSNYGIIGDYYYSDDTGIEFNLNLGQSNTASIYCVPVTSQLYMYFDMISYINQIINLDIFGFDTVFNNGVQWIDSSKYNFDIGGFKLVAVSNNTVYEWLFIYSPDGFSLRGSANEQIGNRAKVYEYINSSSGQVLINQTDTLEYTSTFTHSGSYSTSNASGFTRVRLQLGSWSRYSAISDNDSDFYAFVFDYLSFDTTLSSLAGSCSCANVAIRNASSGSNTLYYLGTVSNITRSNDSNSNIQDDYIFYFPSDIFTKANDVIEIVIDFYNTLGTGSSYDYVLTIGKIDMYRFRDPSNFNGAYGAMDSLDNAGDILGDVEKPDISTEDLDIFQYVDIESIAQASSLVTRISTLELFVCIFGLLAVFSLVAYLLFGKR